MIWKSHRDVFVFVCLGTNNFLLLFINNSYVE